MNKKIFIILIPIALGAIGWGVWATSNPHSWTNGLIGYWSFDGQYTTTTSGTGAGTRDTSGNNNWGTFSGEVKPVGGISGQALSFDGVDDTVYKSNPSFINDTAGSIELWFKLAATNVSYSIANINVEGATGALRDEYLFLYYRGDVNQQIELMVIVNGVTLWEAKTANSIVTDLLWHHWVVTSDGATVKAYLDGTARTLTNVVGTNTGRWMAAATDADVFALGAIRRDVPVVDFAGQMDEVRIYNRALGADEIKQHYEQTRRNLIINQPSGTPPVGWWKMDEPTGATVRDYSANANNGTPTGTTSTDGKIGRALSFDGVDDYVNVGSSATLDAGTGNQTIEAWIKTNSATDQAIIYMENGGPQFNFRVVDTGVLRLNVLSGGLNSWDDTSETVNNGNWHHVAAVWLRTSMQIYIDGIAGTMTHNGTYPTAAIAAGQKWIGKRPGTGGNQFNGLIDDVRIYNYARTADQIASDYRAGAYRTIVSASVPSNWWTDELVGYWSFDGQYTTTTSGTGAGTRDTSGNNNWGAFNGGVKPVGGISGQALSFDGVDDYVGKDSGVSGIGGQTQMTYEVWIKRGSTGTGDYIYGLGSAAAYKYQSLAILSDNTIRADFGNDANNNYRVLTTTATLTDTASWHHLAATYNAGTIVIYVDGVSWTGSYTGTWTGAVVAETTYLRIGGVWAGAATVQPFHGLIDEVRLYNRALGADEVKQHYEQSKRNLRL